MISVIIPTRKRYEMFIKSIDSLYENCSDVNNFEILVATDEDDKDTTDKIKEYYKSKSNIKYYEYPRQHYIGLHKYINDLSIKSTGISIFFWCDDAIMLSKDWDKYIIDIHSERFCLINPKVQNMEDYWRNLGVLFPIIPKKWVDITGSFSESPGNDSWIDLLSKKLNLEYKCENIVLFHDRFDETSQNKDETYIESRKDLSNQTYYYWPWDLFDIQLAKLKEYLESIN